MPTIAEQICRVGRLMFNRRLTDIAGGNISARDGDFMYITPTGAGQKWLWELAPSDLLHCRIDSDELMQHPQRSNESPSHREAYRVFPEVGAVIHAHPFHLMPFLAAAKAPRPLIPETQMYGELEFITEMPFYDSRQAAALIEKLSTRREIMARKAAAVLMPRHGIFIAGKDLLTCLDCLERIDAGAWANLMLERVR